MSLARQPQHDERHAEMPRHVKNMGLQLLLQGPEGAYCCVPEANSSFFLSVLARAMTALQTECAAFW